MGLWRQTVSKESSIDSRWLTKDVERKGLSLTRRHRVLVEGERDEAGVHRAKKKHVDWLLICSHKWWENQWHISVECWTEVHRVHRACRLVAWPQKATSINRKAIALGGVPIQHAGLMGDQYEVPHGSISYGIRRERKWLICYRRRNTYNSRLTNAYNTNKNRLSFLKICVVVWLLETN
jgi:hypothetical protein